MSVFRKVWMAVIAAAVVVGPASARVPGTVQVIDLPPSRQTGLDMILIDDDAMPPEPELAKAFPKEIADESWSGAAIDLLKPIHHLYTDLRRQLGRYQREWSGLPQVRIPQEGPVLVTGSTDPRVAILRERLGLPPQGGYDAPLQKRVATYQRAHGLPDDGKAGSATLASLNRGAAYYERLILLNMERARRLPASDGPGRYILVDVGSARLWMYENGRAVDSMKVIVGAPQTETPMMAALMRYASVNPYWNVPPELVRKLIAPRVLSDGMSYLADRGYQVLESWDPQAGPVDPATVDWQAVADGSHEPRVRQLPGAANSMGKIKFMMPNHYGIYLHDTPRKELFEQDDRWISNGCIRVEDAKRLARWLFGAMPEASADEPEVKIALEQTVPTYVTYLTVGSDTKGPTFRADRYGRDAPLLARFERDDDRMVDAPPVVAGVTSAKPMVSPTPRLPGSSRPSGVAKR